MVISFAVIVGVSYPVKALFESETLPKHWDVFRCVVNQPQLTPPTNIVKGNKPLLAPPLAPPYPTAAANGNSIRPPTYEAALKIDAELRKTPANGVTGSTYSAESAEDTCMIDRTCENA